MNGMAQNDSQNYQVDIVLVNLITDHASSANENGVYWSLEQS